MKIKVTPEGRENIWIPEKESLKDFIKSKNFEHIHNFMGGGIMIIGADHEVESMLSDIDKSERACIFTSDENLKHSLALILNNRLECYDIGKIKLEDLIINKTYPQPKG